MTIQVRACPWWCCHRQRSFIVRFNPTTTQASQAARICTGRTPPTHASSPVWLSFPRSMPRKPAQAEHDSLIPATREWLVLLASASKISKNLRQAPQKEKNHPSASPSFPSIFGWPIRVLASSESSDVCSRSHPDLRAGDFVRSEVMQPIVSVAHRARVSNMLTRILRLSLHLRYQHGTFMR
jgi:hypothetical protein